MVWSLHRYIDIYAIDLYIYWCICDWLYTIYILYIYYILYKIYFPS
jgi:hypothetical protein